MNPTKVFAVLAGVIVAVAAIVLLTRPDTAPPSTDTRTPDFSLTDAEAIARFEELIELRNQALRLRDLSLLSDVFTAEGPARDRVAKSIRRLLRDDVFYRTRHETKSVEVLTNADNKVVISTTVGVIPRFVSEDGEDLTIDGSGGIETTEWILRLSGSEWLLHDGRIVSPKGIDT